MAYRDVILSKTTEYVRTQKMASSNRGAIVMIDCPYCKFLKSAQIIQALSHIKCVHCSKMFTLIDLIRITEDKLDSSEEDILNHVKNVLHIDVQTSKDGDDLSKILASYSARNWALVPCAKASSIGYNGPKMFTGKEVIQGEWQKKENRKEEEWFHWISSGLNIGVRTGQVSNLTIIDFDLLTKAEKGELVKDSTSESRKQEIQNKKVIPESIKALMGNTLIQESLGGFHAFYLYTSELRKTSFNYNGFHIDVENDLGQVIISPSNKIGVEEEYTEEGVTKKRIVGYAGRKFINDVPMISIPTEFLSWLQSNIKPVGKSDVDNTIPFDTEDKLVSDAIKDSLNPEFKVKDIQSNRNNTLIALGGIFRKEMNIKQTGFVLNVLNKHVLQDPLPTSEIQHILVGLDKYVGYDETGLGNDIVAYLKETDTASKPEIESAIFGQKTTSENKKRLDKTLMYLIQEEKIIKKNRTDYKILQDMDWKTDLLGIGLPVDFKVPYFHDYAHFNWGDNIIIGGTTKVGKSHVAINCVKRLVKQGVKPRYLFNENGSRYAKIALQLGLKPGDFEMARCANPADIIMRQKNTVYIYDWYRPADFTKTADDFDKLADKLEKSQSFMITFAQLRDGNAKLGNQNEWFAKDQIRQFVAMSAKYMYDDADGVNTYFDVDDVRESKTGGKRFKIPCKYVRESKEVKLYEEIERGE